MSAIGRLARAGVFAGGSLLVFLSITASTFPSPLPTISPAALLPSPSVPSLQDLLSPGTSTGGQPAGGTAPASHQSAPPRTVSGTGHLAGTPQSTGPAAGSPRTRAQAAHSLQAITEVGAAQQSQALAHLPATGAPGGGPGSPLPVAPAAVGGLLVMLFFFGLRMTSRPVTARRYRIKVGFGTAGAPPGAAAAAVRCLLESELPAGARLRAQGDDAFVIEAPILQRAILGTRLAEVAARGRRVGLRLDWNPAEPSRQAALVARPRLAIG